MERNQDPIHELLNRYLRDECSSEERRELLYLLENPENAKRIEDVMDSEAEALFKDRLSMERKVSDRVFDKLKGSIDQKRRLEGKTSKSFYQSIPFSVAASFAGLVLFAGLIFLLLSQNEAQTFTTHEGQKRTVALADGSLVTLNDNSSVSFMIKDNRREIMLDGEAYFDVAHDAGRPFYVRTSGIEIKVLGTVFNVKSYRNDDRVETTLVSGKVVVKNLIKADSTGPDVVELAPNEQVVFFKESSVLAKSVTKAETTTTWRSGKLFFEDETAQVIFSELEKWFRVKIALDHRQRDCRFSMNIGNEDLSDVLGFFEKTTGVKVIKQGDEYRLEGNLCEKP